MKYFLKLYNWLKCKISFEQSSVENYIIILFSALKSQSDSFDYMK